MHAARHIVPVTTDASGNATVFSPNVTGRILSVRYVKTDFADTVDFAITLELTGEGLWTEENVTATKQVYPRVGVHDLLGVAATLDGTRAMRDPVVAVLDRVKIAITNGGNTKAGAFHIVVG